MRLQDCINALPHFFKDDATNCLENLFTQVCDKPLYTQLYKTNQPAVFYKLLRESKTVKTLHVLFEKSKQALLKKPEETIICQQVVLINGIVLLQLGYIPNRNNIKICTSHPDTTTVFPEYRNTIKAIQSCRLKSLKKEHLHTGKISLLMHENEIGFYTKQFELSKPEIQLECYYNDDILPFHNRLTDALTKEESKGIAFLHGAPGTGKTTYIRHLLGLINKRAIFIPSAIAPRLAEPGFVDFIARCKNSLIIIEDAEEIISSRKQGRNHAVSALLNLSDGLLSDCLNLQIICTFNISIGSLDSALLRAGRLIGAYKFKALQQEKSNALLLKHKLDKQVFGPTVLGDIFNTKYHPEIQAHTPIGFK